MIINSIVKQMRLKGQFQTFYKKISQVQRSAKPPTANKNKKCA